MTAAAQEAPERRNPRLVTLPSLPALGGLYAKGVASSGRIAVTRSPVGRVLPGPRDVVLPDVVYRVADVPTAGVTEHLTDYQRLLGERVSDTLPAGYLHVLAFPLATALMVRGDFPLPLLGLVHVSNAVSMHRPVRVGDVLEVRATAEDLRAHRRGVQVDLVTEVSTGGELAYRGVSTYLAKGFGLPSEEEAPPQRTEEASREEFVPPVPTARWELGSGIGRAYGAISGDRNPIHTSVLGAKAFGFPRTIAHGMYTAARALAEVGAARGDAYDWTVEFAAPVLVPGTVQVAITRVPDDGAHPGGFTYVGWNGKSGRRHLSGTVTPR
ncbi:dehydratase [Oerskovia sp. Root918]|uniref:MaoC/PaaZ C-terminal domain-containing protein n=1 Tax=Oerskovia sp. Root918 TaxID=1736607 RepID=UPI0006F31D0B|nr:MaoC/PaaZ C-terminal domain-containing protein [Oerskovia sp. Root918]KRD35669.1 dehydratase [Oerskovia sp. Root918]